MRSSGFFTSQGPDITITEPEKDFELVYSSEDGYCQIWKGFLDDRVVAFKSLKPEYSDNPIYINWLTREYEIGRSLHHPGICETLGWKTMPDIGRCIVLEWIEGESLEKALALNRITEDMAKRIAAELCDATAYLHRKQIIHKDLKPENIIITRRGENVKIIDFGLSDSDAFISGKAPAGTFEYAAPEVISGENADISSDIFSLGVILSKLSPSFSEVASICTSADKNARYSSAEEVLEAISSRRRRPSAIRVMALSFSVIAVIAIGILILLSGKDQVNDLFEEAVVLIRESGISDY